ncbi:MAG: hypothetical protein AB1489_23980 [Acidobacteriota bacterium]
MAHAQKDDRKDFVDPSQIPMPFWRTIIVVIYAVSTLLGGAIWGQVKKLLPAKADPAKK